MLRDMNLSTQTDGKKYSYKDMARLGCEDCKGCSECCRTVEDTIVLDPYDLYQLMLGTGLSVNELMAGYLELGVVDGVVLPHMKMNPQTGACVFLNSQGRCSIHKYRTGFCRLYPLGRLYEDGDFSYILMTDQCNKNRTKVKISKWLDIQSYVNYHRFVLGWHDFLKEYQRRFMENPEAPDMKATVMKILQVFYLAGYDTNGDFYQEFENRMREFAG